MKLTKIGTLAAVGALAAGLALPTSTAAPTLTTNLVASWPLDEPSGSMALDATGRGHTGTLVSAPVRVAGKVGRALSFSGSAYVSVPDVAEIRGAPAVTLGAWMKRSASSARVLLGKQSAGHDLAIEQWGDGRVYFDVSSGSYADGYLTLNDTAWHHLTLVFDGNASGNAGRLKAYVDGVARPLSYNGTVPSRASTKSQPFYLGRLLSDRSNGLVDEVRLYDRALAADEVFALMNAGLTTPVPPLPTIALGASPVSVTAGASTTLTWSTTDATGCSASNGWTGARPATGTEIVTPGATATATYALSCTGAGGTATASTIVTVTVPPPPPPPPPPPDTAAPARSAAAPSGTLPVGTRAATLAVTTDEAATCRYDTVPGTAYAVMTGPMATTTGRSHTAPLVDLADGASYSYVVRCADAVGNIDSDDYTVSFAVAAPVVGVGRFPLAVSADRRYLVDRFGAPFRIQGDAAWSLMANLTYAEADQYLTDRQARGFDTVLANIVEHKFAENAPANRRGDQPFTTAGNLATPNEAYFSFVDSIIDLAASRDIAVMLTYLYLGNGGGDEGWEADLARPANTQAVAFEYGRYLGNRYKDRANVIWVAGGDHMPTQGSEVEARVHKILEGIRSTGSTQLVTAHWTPDHVSTDVPAFAADVDLTGAYEYGVTSPESLAAYRAAPAHPAFLLETGYEAEGWVPGDPASVRAYEYDGVLSAIGGVFYGHRDMWEFSTDTWASGYSFGHQRWQLSLDAPGARDMTRLDTLFDSLPWWRLVPSNTAGMRRLVTAGGGTDGALSWVTAAATAAGDLVVAYVPPTGTASRTVTIDASALAGPARARWFNPTSGAFVDIATALANTSGSVFTTPGDNGSGANDWLLVLDRP